MYTNTNAIPRDQFQIVSMTHSIEHFTDLSFDSRLAHECLEVGGQLFLQVNDTTKNTFDILVPDHLKHFDRCTLKYFVERAGFKVIFSNNKFIGKEISLLARKVDKEISPELPISKHSTRNIREQPKWLAKLSALAKELSDKNNLCLFGSSIATTWLYGELSGRISYFVDEDPDRVGKCHVSKMILAPQQVPNCNSVLTGLTPAIAKNIAHRLKSLRFKFLLPPEFSDEYEVL